MSFRPEHQASQNYFIIITTIYTREGGSHSLFQPPHHLSVLIFCLQSQKPLFFTFIADCVFQQFPLGHAGLALNTSQWYQCSSATELKQEGGRRRSASPEELPGIIVILLFCSLQSKGSSPQTHRLISASNNWKCFHSLVLYFFSFWDSQNLWCAFTRGMKQWSNIPLSCRAYCFETSSKYKSDSAKTTCHILQVQVLCHKIYILTASEVSELQFSHINCLLLEFHIPIRCQNSCLMFLKYK